MWLSDSIVGSVIRCEHSHITFLKGIAAHGMESHFKSFAQNFILWLGSACMGLIVNGINGGETVSTRRVARVSGTKYETKKTTAILSVTRVTVIGPSEFSLDTGRLVSSPCKKAAYKLLLNISQL